MANEKKQFDFIGKRKIFLIIAGCVLVLGIIANIVFGTELDINFKGGTIFAYSYSDAATDQAELTQIGKDVLGDKVAVSFTKDLSGDSNQVTYTLVDVPPVILTYNYTSTGSAELDSAAVQSTAEATLGQSVTVDIDAENSKVVVTPSDSENITDAASDTLTTDLGTANSGYTFTLASTNSVNDIADELQKKLVSDYGTSLTYTYAADSVDTSALTTALEADLGKDLTVTADTEAKTVTVIPADATEADGALSEADQNTVADTLSEYGLTLSTARYNSVKLIQSNSVKPTVGQGFFVKCIFAMIIGGLIITIYIAIRFRKIGGMSAALFATLALVHDIAISYFVYVVFRIPLDDNFIAVVLTILGYSINGTIVVYDRIRDNGNRYGRTKSVSELVNMSVNGVLTRNIYTTVSTFLAVATICIVAQIRGLTSIISFAFPMSIGILAGFYSSLFLSSPAWAFFRERKLAKDAVKAAEAKKNRTNKKK